MTILNQKHICFLFLLFLSTKVIIAQSGGDNTYDFLTLTSSARVAALGGNNISIQNKDINFAIQNPALLNKEMSGQIVLNYVPYMSDINYGYFGYAKHYDKIGTFSIGILNINYGEFDRTDEYGEDQGTTTAAEYALGLTYARSLSPRLSMALTFKPIYSKFDTYHSFGLAADFGIHYKSKDETWGYGLVLKNFGSQITTYAKTKEDLPDDIQIGISKKLSHAPFRFSLTLKDLTTWDLSYTVVDEENATSSTEDGEVYGTNFGDNLLRHMILGVEFLPAKNFHIDFGYNHRRRKELSYSSKLSTVGYSWGFGFRVYKFFFSYGSAKYHLGGSSNHFSISTKFGK